MGCFLSIRADVRDAVRSPSDENVNAAFRNTPIEPSLRRLIALHGTKCKLGVVEYALLYRA